MPKILLVTCFFAIFYACGPADQPTKGAELDFSLTPILDQVDQILWEMAQKNLFIQLSTERQQQITQLMGEIKTALLRLQDGNNQLATYHLLSSYVDQLADFPFLERDQIVMTPFFQSLQELLGVFAKKHGINYQKRSWVLFSYQFSNGLAPFANFSTHVPWDTDFAIDRYFTSVTGQNNIALLVSPEFDLSEVNNPAFQITHSLRINRNTGKFPLDPFNRREIMEKVFTAYVAADFSSQNLQLNSAPWENWQKVSLGKLPSSFDFHTRSSGPIDLSEFAGKKVNIIFLFDHNASVYGRHFLTWQIEKFELLGNGGRVNPVPVAQVLWKHQFTNSNFSQFLNVSLAGQEGAWQTGAHGGVEYAKISTNGKDANSWLISPRLVLPEMLEKIFLEISYIVKNPSPAKMRLLVSTDYLSKEMLIENATWKEVTHFSGNDFVMNNWITLQSLAIDLNEYRGKSIVLAFQFLVTENDNMVWEIVSMQIMGKGEELLTLPW